MLSQSLPTGKQLPSVPSSMELTPILKEDGHVRGKPTASAAGLMGKWTLMNVFASMEEKERKTSHGSPAAAQLQGSLTSVRVLSSQLVSFSKCHTGSRAV